jgi:type I restriction enzyme S subunit
MSQTTIDKILVEFGDLEKNKKIEIIDGDRGKNYPKKEEMHPIGFCLFLNTGNFKNDCFNFSTCDFINEKKDTILRQGKLKRHDVILTTRGTVGSVAFFNSNIPYENIRINSGMIILRTILEVNSNYLYQTLKSPLLKKQIELFSSGAAQPQLPIKDFRRIKIPIPSLPIQKKIAAMLTVYDDLIEINNKRIALLEKMAEELYKEWFVRMRFPGYKETKFIKGVPEGWEIKKVKKVIDRKRFGKIYREDELSELGKIPVIDQSQKDVLGYYDGEPEHKATEENPMILFGDHSCKIKLMIEPFSLAENVIPFKSLQDIPIFFLYYLVRNLVETQEYKRHWSELTNKTILLPTEQLQEQFADTIKINLLFINKLEKNNDRLIKIRNILLDRLMSGKLNVENLNIKLPKSMMEK